jgi:hypothetical protein
MRRIEAWETEDGTLCASQEAALRHEFEQAHTIILGASAVSYLLNNAASFAIQLAEIENAKEPVTYEVAPPAPAPGPFDGYKPGNLAEGPWVKGPEAPPLHTLGGGAGITGDNVGGGAGHATAPRMNCSTVGMKHAMNAAGYCNVCGFRAP